MKILIFFGLALTLTFGPIQLISQNHNIFSGGNGDGFSQTHYAEPLNNSIFGGRDADGFSFTSYAAPLNNMVFAGGDADGFANISFAQALNNGIFAGGDTDGFSFRTYAQPLNNGIFAGGDSDGFSNLSYAQVLNNNIFIGGNADGHSAIAYAQPLNNNIYAGGDGDGFDIQDYQTTFSEVAIKVILQGPFDPNTGLMRRDLSAGGADDDIPLPIVEPYSNLGYVLQNGGTSILTGSDFVFSDVVDWMVVELRDLNSGLHFARAALLLEDGSVVNNQFSPTVKFRNIPAGNYHVAVRHRNHLGVMTQGTIAINNN